MKVGIRLERHSYVDGLRDLEEEVCLGPFDWIEVEGNRMVAEADSGNRRFDELAWCGGAGRWETQDGRKWDSYCIYPFTPEMQPDYIIVAS